MLMVNKGYKNALRISGILSLAERSRGSSARLRGVISVIKPDTSDLDPPEHQSTHVNTNTSAFRDVGVKKKIHK